MTPPRIGEEITLGPANYQARVQAGTLVEDHIYAITFRQSPPYIVAYDPTTEEIVETHEIPMDRDVDSPGAWNLVTLDDRYLYTILHEPTVLIRFDRQTETVEQLHEFPQTEQYLRCCRAIETIDDRVVFAIKIGPDLFEWEHETERLIDVGRVHPTALKAIDLAVTEGTTYVGGGTDAYLTAVDRSTGAMESILPSALKEEIFVQSVAVTNDGRVAIGTSPGMQLAIVDPASPEGATIVEPPMESHSGAITALSIIDGVAYFTTTDPSYAIWAYDVDRDDEPKRLATPIDHPTRDIFDLDGSLLGVGSGGYSAIWTVDPTTSAAQAIRLGDVGLPKGVGNVQSFHAMDGDVYAGGSRVTDIHHVDSGSRHSFPSPGEPKVMCDVDGRLYQGVYGGAGLAEYNPTTNELRELAWIGHDQNRPRALHYHEQSGLLLMGTRPDYGQLGGAIAAYDLGDDTLRSVDRHVVRDQTVNAVTSISETVYLGTDINGGIGSEPTTDAARIVAWDPLERAVHWSTELDDCPGVLGLVSLDDELFGTTIDGSLFGFDASTRERTVERSTGGAKQSGDLIAHEGRIYGVDSDQLYGYEPATDTLSVLLDDLDAGDAWHNFPQLTVDEAGDLYVARNKNLVRVHLTG